MERRNTGQDAVESMIRSESAPVNENRERDRERLHSEVIAGIMTWQAELRLDLTTTKRRR
jgi:hypothetical protein